MCYLFHMGEYHQLPQLFYAYRRRQAGNVAAHSHGGCELIYLLRGSCRVEGVHGVLEGKAGHLLVIPPEAVHNQIDSQDEKNIFCVFQAPPELFELSKMTEQHDFEGANAILLGLLQKLAAFEKKHANTEFLHPGLRRALAFLYNNSSRNISVEQIAEESGISVSLLRKLFVDYCGVSPVHFLQNLRISRAEEMLKNSNLSISEIALTSGFENSGYFRK